MNRLRNCILPYAFPGLSGFFCAFTTRASGNLSLHGLKPGSGEHDAAVAARSALLETLDLETWSEVKQVHGDAFVADPELTLPEREGLLEADGMGSIKKKHALFIKIGDCQPILLAHPGGYVAALHVGWRGNVLQFPQSAVANFCAAYSLDPADVHAVRGPSLGYAEFVNFSREWPPEFAPWYDRDARRVDLWALTRRQLCDAGLKPGRIHGIDMCTFSLESFFFSHRRGESGRQAALVWMT